MTEQDILKLLKLNINNYPGRFLPNATEEQINTMKASWFAVLGNLPIGLVLGAYHAALTTCEFPVTVADIFKVLRKQEQRQLPSVEALWQELIKTARYCSEQAYYFGCANGQEYENRAIHRFKELSPCCKEFIGNRERLAEVNSMASRDREQFYFPRFRKFVEFYQEGQKSSGSAGGLFVDETGINRLKEQLGLVGDGCKMLEESE